MDVRQAVLRKQQDPDAAPVKEFNQAADNRVNLLKIAVDRRVGGARRPRRAGVPAVLRPRGGRRAGWQRAVPL
jgi:hypothetical protein